MNARRDPETYAIIGAAMEVHSVLGPGYLEAVYQAALAWEMALRSIPHQRELAVRIWYKDRPLPVRYTPDFVCHASVIVELKAVRALTPVDDAQVIHYLKAARLRRALLLNFGTPSLELRRFVNTDTTNSNSSLTGVEPPS